MSRLEHIIVALGPKGTWWVCTLLFLSLVCDEGLRNGVCPDWLGSGDPSALSGA